MTQEEAKKELQIYKRNKKYVARKQEYLVVLTEQINKVTATYSNMPRGGGSSKEDLIAKKLDIERDIETYIVALLEQTIIIERILQKLEPEYRDVLDYVYVQCLTVEKTAEEEECSDRQIYRRLNEAYKLYAEVRGAS